MTDPLKTSDALVVKKEYRQIGSSERCILCTFLFPAGTNLFHFQWPGIHSPLVVCEDCTRHLKLIL